MVYFCIDVEASGLVPPLFNLLSIGATALHDEDGALRIGRSFYVELKPIFPGFDPAAMKVCGLDRKRLEADGAEPADAMMRLSQWVRAEGDALWTAAPPPEPEAAAGPRPPAQRPSETIPATPARAAHADQ